jgi:hypothetical protein
LYRWKLQPSLNSLANTAARQAQNNWWGAWDGPRAGGIGGGDTIPTSFNYVPFLTTPPFPDCPILPVITPSQNVNVIYRTAKAITLAPYGGMAPYSYSLSTPAHGTLSGTAPNLTYTPTALFTGADSFTFKVTDEGGFTSIGTINLTITWGLDAQNQTLYTPANTAINVNLNTTGAQPPFTFSNISIPMHGTWSGTAPNLVYTPNNGFYGIETITFKATDSTGFSDTGTITINIAPVLQTSNQFLYGTNGTPKSITLQTSGGRPPYTYMINTPPTNGVLNGTSPSLTYTFNAGFSGADYFTYSVTDANSVSVSGTIRISNGSVLTATDGSIFTSFETGVLLPLAATGGFAPYSFAVVPQLNFGTVSGTSPNLIYTPNTNYSGTHSLTYKVIDANGFEDTASLAVTVGQPLTMPNQNRSTPYETPLGITITASGGLTPYQYSIASNPSNGTVTGTAPALVYTPNTGFSGSDSFTVTVTDTGNKTATATITILVPAPTTVAAGDVAGLMAAIQAASTNPQPDTIILSAGTYLLSTINNTSPLGPNAFPIVTDQLTIRGNGATITRANGALNFRFFEVGIGGNLTLNNLTLSNGNAGTGSKPGGAIANQGTATLVNVTITNNQA